MVAECLFKGQRVTADLLAAPRSGDFVWLAEFDRELRVERVVWTREGVLLELEDPARGHAWVGSDDGNVWLCQRCGASYVSEVPPSHPNFPGSPMVKGWVDECDVEIARGVHAE